LNAELAGRPELMGKRTSLTLYPGMTHLMENAAINVNNKSHTVTAQVEVPEEGVEGVIIAQGGRFGGWSLYVKDGRPAYCHNWIGVARYTIAAQEPLPPGPVTLRYVFAYDGGRPGAGGTGTLYVNGKQVAQGKLDKTVGYTFSLDEGMDVGMDLATPVTEDYAMGDNAFTGKIHCVNIDIGQDDTSHLRDPEVVFHGLMAGQ
jgi:arylsulfatase